MANNVQSRMAYGENAELAKLGSDTAVHDFTGANTHAGAETFNGAVTLSSAVTIDGALTVNSAATFGGTTTFNGALDINSGATITLPTGSATLEANAGTLNTIAGFLTTTAMTLGTTEALSLTMTNSNIAAGDLVQAWPMNMTASDQAAAITRIVPGAGSVVLDLRNVGTASFNGTCRVGFVINKAG